MVELCLYRCCIPKRFLIGLDPQGELKAFYASLMLALTRSALLPVLITNDERWSLETCDTDDHSVEIPSLILALAGEDKSTISLHFSGLCFLGIAPNELKCILYDLTSCLCILPNCTFCCRYSDTIAGSLIGMFLNMSIKNTTYLEPLCYPLQ